MTPQQLQAVDKSNMYALLRDFPTQVREAIAIGEAAQVKKLRGVEQIVLCGLGGSAIGGDLLRSYLSAELELPFIVNRHYVLPHFVGPKTLVIISSYSGNTEETNAAHREALKRGARILCISSNGQTAKLAQSKGSPLITVPGGLPPRAALGYSFFPLLITLVKLGFIAPRPRDLAETLALLETKATEYANTDPASNFALQLAGQIRGRLTVIYSSTEHFDAVNTRWRGQIAENGKALAFGHVVPEMNHNELVGWKSLRQQMGEMRVLFLRDKGDYHRVQVRMDITKEIIHGYAPHITEIWSEGRSLLARMFSLIHLGDWTSYYLAILHEEDPTPVAVIDHLKKALAEV